MRVLACLICLSLLVVACKKDQPVTEERPDVYPYELTVSVDNGQVTLAWKREGSGLVSGYNIYVNDMSRSDLRRSGISPEPYNQAVFPGDTNPDDGIEHYDVEGLQNGKTYYAYVEVVYPDRSTSRPSNEITAVPGPRGEMTLQVRYKGENDGFVFAREASVRADDVDNDIYFYTSAEGDFLATPTRLNGFLRESRFAKINRKGDLDEVARAISSNPPQPADEKVAVTKGDWVLMRTAEGYSVLLKVLALNGSGEDRTVRLQYAVSMSRDGLFF
jgi:hypothetical protein